MYQERVEVIRLETAVRGISQVRTETEVRTDVDTPPNRSSRSYHPLVWEHAVLLSISQGFSRSRGTYCDESAFLTHQPQIPRVKKPVSSRSTNDLRATVEFPLDPLAALSVALYSAE